uniref:DDE Tnp4 domain-containing protein n=1 Tax=Anopheles dirus TaxID=7168 RepID=A0A182NLM8_9DIPT
FLASGADGRHVASVYRISKSSFTVILNQVCDAIVQEFKGEFMKFSNENWLNVANEFNYRWNFPNCVGAIDGKHIAIVCPANSGSLFYNYKKFFSIVMMAICDAEYKYIFMLVEAKEIAEYLPKTVLEAKFTTTRYTFQTIQQLEDTNCPFFSLVTTHFRYGHA